MGLDSVASRHMISTGNSDPSFKAWCQGVCDTPNLAPGVKVGCFFFFFFLFSFLFTANLFIHILLNCDAPKIGVSVDCPSIRGKSTRLVSRDSYLSKIGLLGT